MKVSNNLIAPSVATGDWSPEGKVLTSHTTRVIIMVRRCVEYGVYPAVR